MQDEKTLEFLQKIKELGSWNKNYDYSKLVYKGIRNKVVVIDKKYNSKHLIWPEQLKKGIECSIRNVLDSQAYILNRFKELHGNRYNYQKFVYKSSSTKSVVICPNHGEFQISSNKHLMGQGCYHCGVEKTTSSKKLSNNQIIEKFTNVHGDRYNYSKVNYDGGHRKVKIICSIHGEFTQTPSNHIRGNNCPKCAGNIKYNNNSIIKKFKEVHGDRYDYSKVEYTGAQNSVIVICKEHGEFNAIPSRHINDKRGCPYCGGTRKHTQSSIIKKFIETHGDEYDYSLVDYKAIRKKVKIICKEHGVFEQIAHNHANGMGCPICYIESTKAYIDSGKKRIGVSRYNTKSIIKRFQEVHGERYDYSKVEYVGYAKPVKIICREHGVFTQKPSRHINDKRGCAICGGTKRYDTKSIVERFKEVHGDRYDYSLVDYKAISKKVKIICKEHGVFEQIPHNHANGMGCSTCSRWGNVELVRYINDIRNQDVLEMDPVELNMLISQGKLPKEFEELVFKLDGTGENSLKSLKEKLGIENDEKMTENRLNEIGKELEKFTEDSKNEISDAIQAVNSIQIQELEEETKKESRKGLPSITNGDILVLDKELINTCDDEAVEFFIQYKLRKVWNEVLNDKRDANEIKSLKGGKNSTRLKDLFTNEFNEIKSYKPPSGYSFMVDNKIAPPNMMQKLTVNRLKEYGRYGNWSGTGAGKTISFIIASREINSRLTLVVCLNSTVNQLEEDILEVYPDSKVHNHFKKGQVFDRNDFNYLLLNYEKFQQGYSEEIFQDLNKNNQVDFIVIDEVHNAKQRGKEESLRRGSLMRLIGRSTEQNPELKLLGMSATPVINNLIEAKSLLQLITGKKYEDISTRGTINNALKVFNQLLLNGVRYIPKYEITLNELTGDNSEDLDIDGSDKLEHLKDNGNKDYLGLEKILIDSKMSAVKKFIKPKTIIYTYFTDNDKIPNQIAKYIKSLGYSYALYIGGQSTEEREESKKSFAKGDKDILIASRIIGTGVDGLQKVSNRMIILTLPWTDSEYTQLKGRIYRQGSKFGDVDIVIPQVSVTLDNNLRWSWDKQRLQLIRDKRTLADAAVDGIIPSKHLPSRERLCSDSLRALKEWKERINKGKILLSDRKNLTLPLRPEIVEYLRPSLGDFSELNRKWSISRSSNTFERLKSDPFEWNYYHTQYREKRKEWDEIPYEEIAKKIKTREDWVVADLGCGENLLSKEINNKVHAFDYIAKEGEDVIACDMSNVPLDDNTVDVAVFSLSLMGSNYEEYLKESYRILKPYGNLFIAEPKKKGERILPDLKKHLTRIGFKIVDDYYSSNFLYIDCVKS